MKKLLSIALCAAAAVSFAEEVTVATVGVTEVTIPAGQQNTIIASSFNALGGSTGVTVEKLIKTATGLAANDQLMVFRDGKYYTFNWNGSAWSANAQVGSDTSTLPVTTATTVGEGIWFIRGGSDLSSVVKLYLYGDASDATSVTTTAGAWNLIGNPTETAFTFSATTGTKGDRIVVVDNGTLREYVRKSSGWFTTKENGSTVSGTPAVAAGFGIWYNPKSATSFDWSSSSDS